jgi:hypothetical protein|mmetsp:Transcript_96364/g.152372  ORF Transcript_96364/g.152372 Transcript_96364/m.152372 type:complete len:433 (+) Transcript_96364:58-1356(+)|eukprot:CAMPEP_0169283340 /NCGR_PEP_ID=MMETSP1016-20121227/57488_1 /TAXON_ID=342587 /ORGANISM="Karlodinium micrum, Strain CCMP2283" /LENGTH=432 /DNA_ID=CAMNT_0009372525 /DNA_START=39 /DNA_END=1337 /DNA_ORIENTATION=-
MLGSAVAFLTARAPPVANLALARLGAPGDAVETLRNRDPHYGMDPAIYALIFGVVSGLSLPLGAGAGIYLAPVRPHTCALMMAFGAGALLFAVTVELYGHALREVEAGRQGLLEMFTIIFGALSGAAFYLTANQWLKDAFPEDEGEADDPMSSRSASARTTDEKTPLILQVALEAKREAKKQHDSAKQEHQEHKETAAPLMAALSSAEHKKKEEEKKEHAKEGWAKLKTKKRQAIALLSKDKYNMSFNKPREVAIKAACNSDEIDRKGLTVALGIFLGLLVDGLPEGILMGFLSAEGHLTPVLIVSLFVANLPEAFASGSLMIQAGLSTTTIMGLWSGLCLLVGTLCGLSCYLLLFFFPEYGAHGHALPTSVLVGIALVEGITGGAMIACISSVMLPEAFANCDKNRPFLHQTGFLCTAGFLTSVGLKTLFG